MGQYYTGVNLTKGLWFSNDGAKLMEHSWIKNGIMNGVEHLLKKEWKGDAIVWAGDYMDEGLFIPKVDKDSEMFFTNGDEIEVSKGDFEAFKAKAERLAKENGSVDGAFVNWREARGGYAYTRYMDKSGEVFFDDDITLYRLVDYIFKEYEVEPSSIQGGRYILNHTLNEFVDKRKTPYSFNEGDGYKAHSLSLLTSSGNGRGGGDYRGPNEELCGRWSGHSISIASAPMKGMTELIPNFAERNTEEENKSIPKYIISKVTV